MPEKLNTFEQKTEVAPSLESPQSVEAQLPAISRPSPEAAIARIGEIDQKRSSELIGLNAARAALNLPPTETSVAISAFDEERGRLHSGLQSQENPLRVNRDKLSPDQLSAMQRAREIVGGSSGHGVEEFVGHEATQASDEQMRNWEEFMRQLGGEESRKPEQTTQEVIGPASSLDSLKLTGQSSPKMLDDVERPALESSWSKESDLPVAQERVTKSARNAAQKMLDSMKRVRDLVGTPTEEDQIEMIVKGMPYSDTVGRLERFLSADASATNERSSISPPIRQYFLELGPQETMRRAQGAKPSFMEDVAEKVRQGDLQGTVGMMESLDPIYKKARERAGNDPLFMVDRALSENIREIVDRLKHMNGGGA